MMTWQFSSNYYKIGEELTVIRMSVFSQAIEKAGVFLVSDHYLSAVFPPVSAGGVFGYNKKLH